MLLLSELRYQYQVMLEVVSLDWIQVGMQHQVSVRKSFHVIQGRNTN